MMLHSFRYGRCEYRLRLASRGRRGPTAWSSLTRIPRTHLDSAKLVPEGVGAKVDFTGPGNMPAALVHGNLCEEGGVFQRSVYAALMNQWLEVHKPDSAIGKLEKDAKVRFRNCLADAVHSSENSNHSSGSIGLGACE